MRLLKLFTRPQSIFRVVTANIYQPRNIVRSFCEGNFGGTGSVTYSGGQASQGQGGFYVSLCIHIFSFLNNNNNNSLIHIYTYNIYE